MLLNLAGSSLSSFSELFTEDRRFVGVKFLDPSDIIFTTFFLPSGLSALTFSPGGDETVELFLAITTPLGDNTYVISSNGLNPLDFSPEFIDERPILVS